MTGTRSVREELLDGLKRLRSETKDPIREPGKVADRIRRMKLSHFNLSELEADSKFLKQSGSLYEVEIRLINAELRRR